MEREKVLAQWKKVELIDLDYISKEIRELMVTPCMVFLEGEMGAGKTTFLQAFFPSLKVMSPSYSLINEAGRIAHGDFCRLKEEEELVHLELPLYLDRKDYFFLEWGRKFLPYLQHYLDSNWSIYQLNITVSEENRHYTLLQIVE